MKHKKILLAILALPLFTLVSCSKPKEPYKVFKQKEDDSAHLMVDVTNFPNEISSGEELPVAKMVVTYNGSLLTWLDKDSDNIETEGKFFITTSATYPVNSVVKKLGVDTNVERNELIFYVACFDKNVGDGTIFVSKDLKIIVNNNNAIKPWVWYVVTGVVIFGVIGMVMFTRHYKAKKEDRK